MGCTAWRADDRASAAVQKETAARFPVAAVERSQHVLSLDLSSLMVLELRTALPRPIHDDSVL
jgi:hypothetical protein